MTGPTKYGRRLHQTLAITVGLAVVIVTVAIWMIVADANPATSTFDVTIATIVLAVAARMTVHLRVGRVRLVQSLTDTAMMLGLITLGWPWLVVALTVGVTVGRLLARLAWRQIAFATAKNVITVAAAAGIGLLVGLGPPPLHVTVGRLPGLLIVAAAVLLVDDALASPMLALVSAVPVRQIVAYRWRIRIGGSILRLTFALIIGYVLRFDSHIAIVTPLVIIGLQLEYANHTQQRADRVAWQRLARIVDVMSAADAINLPAATIHAAAELFTCDEVDLELADHGARTLLRGDTGTITYAGPPESAPYSSGMVVSAPLDMPDNGGAKPGELRLRFHSSIVFTEREHYMLRALAAALGTAIHKANAVDAVTKLVTDQAYTATHDLLTGLANRPRLLASRQSSSPATGGGTAVVVLYLNRFKQINDTLGQAVGDSVLIEVARRLTAALPDTPDNLVARLAGAEFAVMRRDASAIGDLMPWVRELIAAVSAPMEIGEVRLEVGATAGLAVGVQDGSVDELLRRAEVAMYQAKDQGEAMAPYVAARDTADTERLALTADLARAVAERKFTVAFQPIVDLTTGVVISAEALARWYHPRRGHLAPDRFVDAIERSGLLAPFTSHVLDRALAGAAEWRRAGFDFPVAVNVSPRSLLDPAFPDSIPRMLAQHDLPPEALTIELTETITLSRLGVVDDVLQELRTLGVSIALDDFGTGYSSLATIARVPVHELKIDRSFVAGLDGLAQAAIVRSTIELGRSLDLVVVAEGIESPEQRERLWRLGCSAGQGHLFARPANLGLFIAKLRAGHDGVPGRLVAPMHDQSDVIQLPLAGRSGTARGGRATPPPTPRTQPGTADSRSAMPE